MRLQVKLCRALGIDVDKFEPMDIYMMGGQIIHEVKWSGDTGVAALMVEPGEQRCKTIAAMTPEQRTTLRNKVMGVLEFPFPPSRRQP